MRTRLKKVLLGCMAAVVLGGMTLSANAELTGSASVDFVSKYIWRGFNLSDGFNVQPGVSLSNSGVTAGYWGSYNYEAEDDNQEHNFYIGYDFKAGSVDMSVGYTRYEFPSLGESESDEFWFGVTFSEIFLSPSLTLYVDVGDEADGGADGEYLILSVGDEVELDSGYTFSYGAGLAYNNELFTTENGLADFTPSIGLTKKVNEYLSIGASVTYSTVLDSDLETSMNADDEFYGGINISIA